MTFAERTEANWFRKNPWRVQSATPGGEVADDHGPRTGVRALPHAEGGPVEPESTDDSDYYRLNTN